MKLIKFLKKLFDKTPEIESETIIFSQAYNWIKNKEKENNTILNSLSNPIKEKLSLFIVEINKKLIVLEDVNLDKSKEDNRTKHIVLSNFKEYVKLVENLLTELEGFDSLDFIDLNQLINSLFLDFNKKAHPKYQKATYLIGKELGEVNRSIQEFLKTYSIIIKENEEIINSTEIIHKVKEKLEVFEVNSKENKEIDSNMKHIKLEIRNLEQKKDSYSDKIKNIEDSETHIENLKNIKRKEKLQLELNKDVISLKQLIDFKTLTKTFHGIEKYSVLVKNFKEKFDESFKNYDNKVLIDLLDKSKLNNEIIIKKIRMINDKSQELKDIILKPKDDKIQTFKEKIKKIEYKIDDSNKELDKDLKRNQKIKDSQREIKDSIKKELLKLNVIIKP